MNKLKLVRKKHLRYTALSTLVFLVVYAFYLTFYSEFSAKLPLVNDEEITSNDYRTRRVREAFKHAYYGYEKYGWSDDGFPVDELRPVSNKKSNNFNAWGVTLFDSLDTMLLMSLEDEFQRALLRVEKTKFYIAPTLYAPFFETTIRYLGGLLSAYALSHEPILLTKADELGNMLLPIFNSTSGLPYFGVNTATGNTRGPALGILAEIASCQLEYTYLAKLTGKKEYYDQVDKLLTILTNADLRHLGGMAPVHWNITSGEPFDEFLSVGAQADSAHEYLLKQYLLTGQHDTRNLNMYIATTDYILTNLLYVSPKRHLLYATSTVGAITSHHATHNFEHLACFLPGLLALGAHILPLDNLTATIPTSTHQGYSTLRDFSLKDLHLWAAEGLAQTCWLTYADTLSGLGPDVVQFDNRDTVLWVDALAQWKNSGSRSSPPGTEDKKPIVYSREEVIRGPRPGHYRDYVMKSTSYLLRPETVESLYLMWRVTGDPRWRERGWKIFEAIERETKTESGYACLKIVDASPAPKDDSMPSYFLAETLKYLYLLFLDEDPISLEEYVFNTEAHPLPVFKWSESEKLAFDIP